MPSKSGKIMPYGPDYILKKNQWGELGKAMDGKGPNIKMDPELLLPNDTGALTEKSKHVGGSMGMAELDRLHGDFTLDKPYPTPKQFGDANPGKNYGKK